MSTTGSIPLIGNQRIGIQAQVSKQSNFSRYYNYIYVVGAFLSLISNLTKADHNIALYGYLFIVTRYLPNLKFQAKIILLASMAVDVLWFTFIHLGIWDSDNYSKLVPWESGVRSWTFWTVIINMILKGFIAAVLFFCDTTRPRPLSA